jgi:hypothetical protein
LKLPEYVPLDTKADPRKSELDTRNQLLPSSITSRES